MTIKYGTSTDCKEWNAMSLWEKMRDNCYTRPKKTWANRWFWSFPIHGVNTSDTRHWVTAGKNCSWILTEGKHPYVQFRVGRHHSVRVIWHGILWGWK